MATYKFANRLNRYLKQDVPSEQDIVWLYYVNENNVETCAQIKLLIGNQPCRALIDTGCQCWIISEVLYGDFKARGLDSLKLPTVKRQALVKVKQSRYRPGVAQRVPGS